MLERVFTTVLNRIAPDAKVQAVEALDLGFANRSFRLTALLPDGTPGHFVVKQYSDDRENVFGQNAHTRATLEHETLTFLRGQGIPCPDPVFFDLKGAGLGSPILVTKHLPGEQILANPANPLWAEQAPAVGALLACLHTLPCPAELIAILPDATAQATWFLKYETMPDYMQAYPDGESIWQIIRHELPKLQLADRGLVHGDYWSGNILWEGGRLTGILDWENVAFGNPGFDVANCRMEMFVDGMDEAADLFLTTYESATGKPVLNLGLCELAVAVQPMWQRAPFLTDSPYQERFRQFVANAKKRL